MPTFKMQAQVEQQVVKTVMLIVTAKTKQEAINKANAALVTYPDPVFEEGVDRMLAIKASYGIPTDISVSEVEKI